MSNPSTDFHIESFRTSAIEGKPTEGSLAPLHTLAKNNLELLREVKDQYAAESVSMLRDAKTGFASSEKLEALEQRLAEYDKKLEEIYQNAEEELVTLTAPLSFSSTSRNV